MCESQLTSIGVSLYTLRHDSRFKLCPVPKLHGFRASPGGQKYHASPHKAKFNKRRCDGENKKGLIQRGKNRKR